MVFAIHCIVASLIAVIGLFFIVAPQRMLFCIQKSQREEVLAGKAYRIAARIGGILMIAVCCPLLLLFGALLEGLLAVQ